MSIEDALQSQQYARLRIGVGPLPDGWTGDWSDYVLAPFTPEQEEQVRSEEHTSELQSRLHLVCRLLLEKKKRKLRYFSLAILSSTPTRSRVVGVIHCPRTTA